jgi:hypothetical protein
MLTPLSISPYNSRFNLDIVAVYNNTYTLTNIVYLAYYGGSSVQAQELNELQESIQNQISLSYLIIENYLEFQEGINKSSMISNTEYYNLIPLDKDTITPLQS